MKKRILYLDQNIWIVLAKVYYKKIESPTLDKINETLIRKTSSGEVVCPISATHLMETLARRNKESRKRLAEFMVMISKGITIKKVINNPSFSKSG